MMISKEMNWELLIIPSITNPLERSPRKISIIDLPTAYKIIYVRKTWPSNLFLLYTMYRITRIMTNMKKLYNWVGCNGVFRGFAWHTWSVYITPQKWSVDVPWQHPARKHPIRPHPWTIAAVMAIMSSIGITGIFFHLKKMRITGMANNKDP